MEIPAYTQQLNRRDTDKLIGDCISSNILQTVELKMEIWKGSRCYDACLLQIRLQKTNLEACIIS
jgi:hypothetical protein